MARVKLSEFRAKCLIFEELELNYEGISVDLELKNYKQQVAKLPKGTYVVKVDQAMKKRGKAGLVFLNLNKKDVHKSLEELTKKGFRYALVEPFVAHEQSEEHYIAMSRTSKGIELSYSANGGVDVESDQRAIKHSVIDSFGYNPKQNNSGLDSEFVEKLYELFQSSHMTLLEINPLVVSGQSYLPLDAAVEVDSAGEFFAGGDWSEADVRESSTKRTKQEKAVEELKSVSPASFSLKVLNPNGSIFLLLSGGGASVVIADELAEAGDYKLIANYGEYSGNPTEDETYLYTKEVIGLLLKSKAQKKVLLIAGGIANFTDVAKTFAGIIRAIREKSERLKKQNVKIFIRRGGPNQEAGLKTMQVFLNEQGLVNEVNGPEYSLGAITATTAKAAK